MRIYLAFGLASALVASLAATAAAEPATSELGQRGHFILGADRLVPLFAYTKATEDTNGFSASTTVTSISLLSYGVPSDIAYTIPRIALDYTVIDNLTIGGAFMAFFTTGNSTTTTTTIGGVTMSNTNDNAKATAWGITPRVGYVVGLGPKLTFWPRGGFSYYSETVTNPPNGRGNSTANGFHQTAIDLEANFVFTPVPHFGIEFGPVADIPIGGATDMTNMGGTTTSIDASQLHVGVTAGLVGWF